MTGRRCAFLPVLHAAARYLAHHETTCVPEITNVSSSDDDDGAATAMGPTTTVDVDETAPERGGTTDGEKKAASRKRGQGSTMERCPFCGRRYVRGARLEKHMKDCRKKQVSKGAAVCV